MMNTQGMANHALQRLTAASRSGCNRRPSSLIGSLGGIIRLAHFTVVVCASLLTCSCHKSGTWSDDPKNWERAFSQRIPSNIGVVHSMYWRSAHWTYEAAYYFQVTGAVRSALLSDTNLVRLESTKVSADYFGEKPIWFAPKPLEAYEVWGYTNEPPSKLRLLIDKTNATAFFTDFQL
jgi:hypothetical protein